MVGKVQRLISKSQLCAKILYSPSHVDRLEYDPDYANEEFPKRIVLGRYRSGANKGRPSRVAWVEDEVDTWLEKKVARRDAL